MTHDTEDVGVSRSIYEEWEERGKVWDKLALKNYDKGRMSHVAFEGKREKGEDYIELWELIKVLSSDEDGWDRVYCGIHEFISMEEKCGE